jgi:hypothetical protein
MFGRFDVPVAWREASDKVSAMNESRKKRLTDYASCAG